jgi:hypothetical protein
LPVKYCTSCEERGEGERGRVPQAGREWRSISQGWRTWVMGVAGATRGEGGARSGGQYDCGHGMLAALAALTLNPKPETLNPKP